MSAATTAWAPSAADRQAFDRVTSARERAQLDAFQADATRGANLAAGDDVITGIALVKPGVFNGYFEVTAEDIDAWVLRFNELSPDTFVPPMRLNHSWDIESVVGWFTDLRRENRADTSAGGTVVPMLVGDLRLVGTPEENAHVKAWIASGKLSKVSSEFWPYRTNTGAEYPSVFAGAAFVDIPAAEGLPVAALRRILAEDATGATLSGTDAGGNPTMSDITPEEPETPAAAEQPTEGEQPAADPTPEDEPTPADADDVADGDGTPEDAPLDGEGDDEEAGDGPQGDDAPPANLRRGDDDVEAEIERRVALRLASEQRIATLSARGILTPAVRSHAEALLRHGDEGVRDAAFAILDAQRAPVALGREAGTTTSTPAPAAAGAVSPDELRELTDKTAFGEAWASLSTEQRKAPEYAKVYDEVRAGW